MHVLVVGAGIIGSAVADALARGGARVVVLDMRSPGRGATQASAGVLAPFVEGGHDDALLALCARSLAMYDDFVAGASARSRRAVEYRRCGTLQVAFDESERDTFLRARDQLRLHDVRSDWLDPAALREAEPAVSPEASGGLLIASHGYVRVPDLANALVQSARLAGAIFESPVEAVDVRPGSSEVEVIAATRRYTADRVVIAAGSWSSQIRVRGASLPRIRPVRGQLLELGWPDSAPTSRIIWGPGCYTVPWSDGGLLVGATVEDAGFDESTTVEGVHVLTTAAQSLLPATRGATVRAIRSGLRPASADGRPIIGALSGIPGVILATGHYRNGILLAPLTAALVAEQILEGRTNPMLVGTSPSRFDSASSDSSSQEHPDETVAR